MDSLVDRLERIVTLVDSAVAPYGFHHPHVLIGVGTGLDDDVELSLADLPHGGHPLDELLGFVAPPTWTAIGVVTYGWAAPLDDVRPSKHARRRRARIVSLVDLDGREAVTTTFEDGSVTDDPGEGYLGDVLRRCLRVPTAPPPPVGHYADVLWLEAILEAGSSIRSWTEVASLRPDGGQVTTSWARLRALAARHEAWGDLAAWMDDGMFARWLLADHPPLDDLLDQLTETIPEELAEKVAEAVKR